MYSQISRIGSIDAIFNSEVLEIKIDTLVIKNKDDGQIQILKADFVIAFIGYRPDKKNNYEPPAFNLTMKH